MTEKEFNLSDEKECVVIFGNQFMVYPEVKVKEFITKVVFIVASGNSVAWKIKEINKLAGSELLK